MGFPSPAAQYADARLTLESLVILHPNSTFYFRAESNTMASAGISKGDILVIDRSLIPADQSIVLAMLDGEFHVRQLAIREGQAVLHTADPRLRPISINDMECVLWGVVTFALKALHR